MATYENWAQYGGDAFTWDPQRQLMSGRLEQTAPGYVPQLLEYRQKVRTGQAKPYEAQQYRHWEEQARAIPTRDVSTLTAAWQGEREGQWTDEGWREGTKGWWTSLDPGSPDVGPIMLQLQDKMAAGTATAQEKRLYQDVAKMAGDWNWRASVPQASDAFNPLGDNFLGALGVLAMGATGGMAAAPLAAGGAGVTTTLGSVGTLAGLGGTAAGALGQEMDIDWLRDVGTGLSAVGGITGGVGGLANLWTSGVNSLSDAANLASSAGRVTSGVGTIADNDALRQAGGYLSLAGQAGSGVDTLAGTLRSGVNSIEDAPRLLRGLGTLTNVAGNLADNDALQQASRWLQMGGRAGGNVSNLLGAARQAQQRGVQIPLRDRDWLRR